MGNAALFFHTVYVTLSPSAVHIFSVIVEILDFQCWLKETRNSYGIPVYRCKLMFRFEKLLYMYRVCTAIGLVTFTFCFR